MFHIISGDAIPSIMLVHQHAAMYIQRHHTTWGTNLTLWASAAGPSVSVIVTRVLQQSRLLGDTQVGANLRAALTLGTWRHPLENHHNLSGLQNFVCFLDGFLIVN